MRFCVLASGSSGNASLLAHGGFGVLLDLGLGPRALARRLAEVGASWDDVDAALLTHVHGDHWNENTLAHLRRRSIPLYCHPSHAAALKDESPAFADLLESGRLCFYEVDRAIILPGGISCRPLGLKHDSGITCGFRFETCPDWLGQTWALAYAADLGSWDNALAQALANVDLLALEFNHDEGMELGSGRARFLIRRVLSDHGHLSNSQAADLLWEVLTRSTPGRLRHLVQLHLSRDCNRPELARAAARRTTAAAEGSVAIHTARQEWPGAWLSFHAERSPRAKRQRRHASACFDQQPWLPGWECDPQAVG